MSQHADDSMLFITFKWHYSLLSTIIDLLIRKSGGKYMYTENILRNRLNSLIENGLLSYDVLAKATINRYCRPLDRRNAGFRR